MTGTMMTGTMMTITGVRILGLVYIGMEVNMLKIVEMTKSYGDKKAVDGLSLHILPGEIYGFIGHNGAGKTTTIKSCAGILPFDSVRYGLMAYRCKRIRSPVKRRLPIYRIIRTCMSL